MAEMKIKAKPVPLAKVLGSLLNKTVNGFDKNEHFVLEIVQEGDSVTFRLFDDRTNMEKWVLKTESE